MKPVILKVVKILIASFLLLFVKFLPLSASHLEHMSKSDLIKNADSIVIGKVIDKYSDWGMEGRYIFTYIRFQIIRSLKGTEEGGEVVLKELGGRVGNREMKVQGGARFKTGERALLFLKKGPGEYSQVVGLSLGKYRIFRDLFSNQDIVENPMNPEIHEYSGKMGKITMSGKRRFLDTFVGEIEEELEREVVR